MSNARASGVLLHPTSVPGRFGIGDLGDEAHSFVDFLESAGQTRWQVLPLGPTGYGDSPYQCFSAFAGNPLLVSPDRLVREGLLDASEVGDGGEPTASRVDYGAVIESKGRLLARAYQNFKNSTADLREAFLSFCASKAQWLDDYALFRALKSHHQGVSWLDWNPPLVSREEQALESARRHLYEQIEAEKFYQWLFFRQWVELKSYANQRGIRIIGDAPIFVALDSADVWTNPAMFKLGSDLKPIVVAGVPPDYFSATGQLWGNPIYNWAHMRETEFRWWIDRFRATFELVDLVRVDHFRGFCASWEIPYGDETAERGSWVPVPGRELFATLKNEFGELPIIAEDLGVITPDVVALRDAFELPGMRILQFGFSGDPWNLDLPHNYVQNSVAYTGTHDNDTTAGWFRSRAGKGSTRSASQIRRERSFCMKYLNTSGRDIHWDFIRAVLASVSDTAIIPMQDLLGLDSSARMNLPASEQGNWNWRAPDGTLTAELAQRLRSLTELYGRLLVPPVAPIADSGEAGEARIESVSP